MESMLYDLSTALCYTLLNSLWILPLSSIIMYFLNFCLNHKSAMFRYALSMAVFSLSILTVVVLFLTELLSVHPVMMSSQLIPEMKHTLFLPTNNAYSWQFNPLVLSAFWCISLLFGLMRFLLNYREVSLLKQSSRPAPESLYYKFLELTSVSPNLLPVQISISNKITTPLACGLFKPVILVPLNFCTILTLRQQEVTLRHELAHLKRGDVIAVHIESFLKCIFFFNPGYFVSHTLINRLREISADEIATPTTRQKKYLASSLLSLATSVAHRSQNQLFIPAAGRGLVERIGLLLNLEPTIRQKRSKVWQYSTIISVLLVLSSTGFAAAITAVPSVPSTIKNALTRVSQAEVLFDEAEALFDQAELAFAMGQSDAADRIHTQAERVESAAQSELHPAKLH